MNSNQKTVLHVAMALIGAMLLFPPFHVSLPNGVVSSIGYSLIFIPPEHGWLKGTVNISLLLAQWLGVLIIGAIAFFLLKDRQ